MLAGDYVRRALEGLAGLYRLTGREEEAASIIASIEEAGRQRLATASLPPEPTDAEVIEAIPAIFARDDLPAAVKWTYLSLAHAVEMKEVCSGQTTHDEVRARPWRARVREAVAHRPSHAAMFDWITSASDCG